MATIRSLIFYTLYPLMTAFFGITGPILVGWMPYRWRAHYLLAWNRCVLWWLRVACGIRYRIEGVENIPDEPFVILSKHQSQWETYFLQLYFHPIATILKQELLAMPGFGWGLRLMKPIPIDRGSPREALKNMMAVGEERIKEGMNVLVFPEGTRIAPGEPSKYARGGASLAVQAGSPVLPIAHNAGVYWPPRKVVKYSGVITVSIGKPIDTSTQSAKEVNDQAQAWIEAEVARMSAKP